MDDLFGKEIILGTYEAFVLGYKLSEDKKSLVNIHLKHNSALRLREIETLQPDKDLTSFADHAHSGSVRAVAAADKFMISSGDDENVKIFNLRKRSEHGSLTHADGTVNAMKFYDKKHLFTGSEDGKVAILKTGTWRVEKTLLKHQSGIIDLAIHPSGKLALSIAKDRKLVTWNLIKGRSAYVTNIKDIANFVKWSPTGEHYVVGFYRRIDFYSTSSAAIDFTIQLNGRSNDVVFIDDVTFAVAGEMPDVEFYSLVSKEKVFAFKAHETRVRCMEVIQRSDDSSTRLLVTASNDGLVKIWSLSTSNGGSYDAKELTSVDTKCRITCMAIHQVPEVEEKAEQSVTEVKVKKKKAKKAKAVIEISEEGGKVKKAKVDFESTSSPAGTKAMEVPLNTNGSAKKSKKCKKKKISVE